MEDTSIVNITLSAAGFWLCMQRACSWAGRSTGAGETQSIKGEVRIR